MTADDLVDAFQEKVRVISATSNLEETLTPEEYAGCLIHEAKHRLERRPLECAHTKAVDMADSVIERHRGPFWLAVRVALRGAIDSQEMVTV